MLHKDVVCFENYGKIIDSSLNNRGYQINKYQKEDVKDGIRGKIRRDTI